MHVTARRLV